MTKDQVKTICEGDDQLQWWAMVLFAEICELLRSRNNGYSDTALLDVVHIKVNEFPRLVVGRAQEIAEKKLKQLPTLEHRVTKLEAAVHGLRVATARYG